MTWRRLLAVARLCVFGRLGAVRSSAGRTCRSAVGALARFGIWATGSFALGRAVRTLARLGNAIRTTARRWRERQWARRRWQRTVAVTDRRGVALIALADDLLVAFVALARLVAALVALADKLPLALASIALLLDTLAIVANDLLVALFALTLSVVALIPLADDELVPWIVAAAVLGAA